MDNNKKKEELYKKLIDMLPIKRKDNSDFKVVLETALENYVDLIKNAGIIELTQEYISDIESSCNTIKEIVTLQCQGKHSEAFAKLPDIIKNRVITYSSDHPSLYRMRKLEANEKLGYRDMFHIPLEKRGKVKTQRYSVPGYPCLYMGESINACWEEMGRPSSWMVSELTYNNSMILVDLRIPNKKLFYIPAYSTLLRFPLIIACMVPVLNDKDDYKPEYIIPQLLMEYIFSGYNRGYKREYTCEDFYNTIHGIRYTSVHKNTDFGFPNEKFDNIVIPIVEATKNRGHCPVLCEQFQITEPTCGEYEHIRGESSVDLGKAGYDSEEQLKRNYEVSMFGKMEERLKQRKSNKITNEDE